MKHPALRHILVVILALGACGDDGATDDRCRAGEVQLADGTCVPACEGEGEAIRNESGDCVACGANEVARDNRCVCAPGYVSTGGACVPASSSGDVPLGTDWHPDPDGDGVTTAGGDDCPYVYDPLQTDTDGDGLGDACDPDFAPPMQDGPVTDLHAEHVTPYGAWLSFTSPRTETYGWTGRVAWSTSRAELESLSGLQTVVDRGDAVDVHVAAFFGSPPHRPTVITVMEPDTRYYLALVREDWTGLVDEISNILEITTLPAPPIGLAATRPRVLATPAMVQDLQTRASGGGGGDERFAAWEAVLGPRVLQAGQDPESVYNGPWFCQTAATLYLATGNTDYRDAALALLEELMLHWEASALDGNQYRWANAALGICLDLLWDEVDVATRERAATAMLEDDEYHVFEDPPRRAYVVS